MDTVKEPILSALHGEAAPRKEVKPFDKNRKPKVSFAARQLPKQIFRKYYYEKALNLVEAVIFYSEEGGDFVEVEKSDGYCDTWQWKQSGDSEFSSWQKIGMEEMSI